MGSQAADLSMVQVDQPARTPCYSYYHNQQNTVFSQLRYHLPAPIRAPAYPDIKSWNQPSSMSPFPHTYLNGQDAIYSFQPGAPPFHNGFYDTDSTFNGEDFEVGSTSGDDDVEGPDSNAQLRSQQLNSDGTPKRPMNAFMIFARKRRPMVSSEQPTMRTGEISKILSKEWSEMRKGDKQFYLDQAKKLKDTFNARWPDYVYRRRPNNSRKRRKVGGVSGIGPVRSGYSPSDGRVGTPGDPAAASGDEAQSQSADSFSSPMSTQSKLLYPTAEFGQAAPTHGLDRSPSASIMPLGYGTPSVYAPSTPANALDEATLLQPEPQPYLYGVNQNYVSNGGSHEHSAEMSPQTKSWHQFEVIPSGTVASSTPPLLTTPGQLGCNPEMAEQLYDWPRTQPQLYEAPENSWGVTVEHRASEGPMMNALLCEELPGPHQGFRAGIGGGTAAPHLYENAEGTENGRYHSAYINGAGFNHVSHAPHPNSPYEETLPDGSPSDYVPANRWVPGTHSN